MKFSGNDEDTLGQQKEWKFASNNTQNILFFEENNITPYWYGHLNSSAIKNNWWGIAVAFFIEWEDKLWEWSWSPMEVERKNDFIVT